MKNKVKIFMIFIICIYIMFTTVYASSIDNATESLDDQMLNMWNQKFEQYSGSIKGSEVRALIAMVITENVANEGNTKRQIELTGITDRANVDGGRTYNVTLGYNSEQYVSKVNIELASSTSSSTNNQTSNTNTSINISNSNNSLNNNLARNNTNQVATNLPKTGKDLTVVMLLIVCVIIGIASGIKLTALKKKKD